MATSRLPTVGGDSGTWGTVLNDYLTKATGQVPGSSRMFYLDAYGADPTGAASSDAAWTACHTDAVASLAQPGGAGTAASGAMIVMGAGIYTFSVGTIAITDSRLGLVGAGKAATLLRTTGNTGILVSARGGSEPGVPALAPVGGFSLWGWDGGNSLTGIRFGDRQYGTLFDIYANGFGGTSSIGFQIAGTGDAVTEGVDAYGLNVKNCNIGISYDGTLGTPPAGTSSDYSRWQIHSINCNVAMQWVNGAHSAGGQFHLTGTGGSATWANPVILAIGASTSDTALLQNCFLHIGVECISGSTTVKDMVIQGTSAGGVQNCSGHLMFLPSSANFTAGSVTGGARFSFTGNVQGSPLLAKSTEDAHRQDLSHAVGYLMDGVQALSSSGTIKTATDGRYGVIPVTETGNVTGMILEKPAGIHIPAPANGAGYQVTVINRSAFTITFAASGTSFVADGVSDVIAALRAATYTYDTAQALWYRT